ncbi:cupin domain-containing protein [Prolixibacteraceae bacterium JC049]|nr:cupin domain-containing protein [Prolixibacteraceae bacterium JC049]
MEKNAKYWTEKLELQPHPEGGYYKEVYRSCDEIPAGAIAAFNGARSCSTSIYYLLEGDDMSRLHRIKSDEGWHFYAGNSAIVIDMVSPEGNHSKVKVGNNLEQDEHLQYFVPANYWFAAHLENNEGFALVGCTVAPGFDFSDFEMANIDEFKTQYPTLTSVLDRYL